MAKKKPGSGAPDKKQGRGKKGGNGGGLWQVIAIAAVTVIVGIIILARYSDRLPQSLRPAPSKKAPEQAAPADNLREINLYFSDEEGLNLKAQKRKIKKGGIDAELRAALVALLDGPEGSVLGRAVPEGTKLRSVSIKGETAFVDLSSEIIEKNSGGSSGEIQTVYSIVDTVTLNFPRIKQVQILVAGKKEATIAGHIDISYPLTADKSFIKG